MRVIILSNSACDRIWIGNSKFLILVGLSGRTSETKEKENSHEHNGTLNLTPGFEMVNCFMFRDGEEAGEVSFYGQINS